ncbi:hypothetical protein Tco_0475505 [Tanacetum coccineum]
MLGRVTLQRRLFLLVRIRLRHQVTIKSHQAIKVMVFSLSNSFATLNDENSIIQEVAMGSRATTSGTQEEGQSSTPIVEKINVLEKHISKGKLVLVDDDGKPLEKVEYPDNLDSDDEVEPIDNETTNFLALNRKGVGYGPKSLWKQ